MHRNAQNNIPIVEHTLKYKIIIVASKSSFYVPRDYFHCSMKHCVYSTNLRALCYLFMRILCHTKATEQFRDKIFVGYST